MVACAILLKLLCPPGSQDGYLYNNGPFSGVTGFPMVPHSLIEMVRSDQAATAVQSNGDACMMLQELRARHGRPHCRTQRATRTCSFTGTIFNTGG